MKQPALSVVGVVALLSLGLGGCAVPMAVMVGASPLSWSDPKGSAVLPLSRDDRGRIVVPASIQGRAASVVLDSAAGAPLLSPQFADGIEASNSSTRTVNERQVKVLRSIKFEFPGVVLDANTAAVVQLPQSASRVDAAIGLELFEQTIIDVDFDASQVRLMPLGAAAPPEGAFRLSVTKDNRLPVVDLAIPGKGVICATIDTGYNRTLGLTDESVRRLGMPTREGESTSVAIDGVRSSRPQLSNIESLAFGGRTFSNLPVQAIGGTRRCGNVIGMQILSRFRLYFDLSKNTIWLAARRET